MAWGYHLMINCSSGVNVSDRENIRNFVLEIVEAVGKLSVGELLIQSVVRNDALNSGTSFYQLLESYSISGHVIDSSGDIYLDIISGETFDPGIVNNSIIKYFSPANINMNFFERNKPITSN